MIERGSVMTFVALCEVCWSQYYRGRYKNRQSHTIEHTRALEIGDSMTLDPVIVLENVMTNECMNSKSKAL